MAEYGMIDEVETLKKAVSGQGKKIHSLVKENKKLRLMLRALTNIMTQDLNTKKIAELIEQNNSNAQSSAEAIVKYLSTYHV